jgi:hypothetical protein
MLDSYNKGLSSVSVLPMPGHLESWSLTIVINDQDSVFC